MKKGIFLTCSLIFSILILSLTAFAGIQYGNYINNNYNYEIIIPLSWTKAELTLSNKHFMYATKDANTIIKVKAMKSSDLDIENAVNLNTWDLRKIDPRLNKIIETEKIKVKKNIIGKILIFEYQSRKNNFLQRTLVTINNGIIYIIDCRAPQYSFYKYEDIFTTAIASFKHIGEGSKTQAITTEEAKKEEKAKAEPIEEDEKL